LGTIQKTRLGGVKKKKRWSEKQGDVKKTRWWVKKTRSGCQTKAVQNNTKNKVRGLKKNMRSKEQGWVK
jgi:hypothetical protein